MAAKKHLGKGLDLLLSATNAKPANEPRANIETVHIEKLFSNALVADDEGNSHEAFYLYRTLADYVQARLPVDDNAILLLTSQALNNAAIILYEAGHEREAREYFKQACDTCPDNEVVRENLKLTSR